MGSKGGDEVTLGYKYFLGMHMVCCHGPIDKLQEITVGEKKVWPLGNDIPPAPANAQDIMRSPFTYGYPGGRPPPDSGFVRIVPPGAPATPPPTPAPNVMSAQEATVSGTIYINAPEIFGGEAREGGVQGFVDVLMGEPTLLPNSYLKRVIGNVMPAFRGVFSLVAKQCFVAAMNPYIKPWSAYGTRIFKSGAEGKTQWYYDKAAIPGVVLVPTPAPPFILLAYESGQWKYRAGNTGDGLGFTPGNIDFDDSAWLTGQGGFGNNYTLDTNLPTPHTLVLAGLNRTVWIRRKVTTPTGFGKITVALKMDDGVSLWWNGYQIPAPIGGDGLSATAEIPSKYVRSGENVLAVRCLDSSGTGGRIFLDVQMTFIELAVPDDDRDMNPAHIIRECLTNTDWGKGYAESTINDDSFIKAADTLFAEEMGMSLLWKETGDIDAFITIVLEHIDGALDTDRVTGKWTLTLVRADFDLATLPVFDDSNVKDIDDFARASSSELVNRVVVTFWDRLTRKDCPITMDNQPLQEANDGIVNSKAVDRTGFTNASLATRIAQRELRTLSSPLASGTLIVNRTAIPLYKGAPFKLTWPEFGVSGLVCRVASIDYGTLTASAIRVTFVEDVFATPTTPLRVSPVSLWQDARTLPVVSPLRYVSEVPYWTIIKEITGESEAEYNKIAATDSSIIATAVRESQDTASASIWTAQGTAPFQSKGNAFMCATMTLPDAHGAMDTILPYDSVRDPERIIFGSYAVWDEELVMVYDFNDTDKTLTVARGVLDTVPVLHGVGSRILFVEGYQYVGRALYADTEALKVKMLPKTSLGEVSLPDAPEDEYTFKHRHIRPYAPANVKVNGVHFPVVIAAADGVSATWSHRNRKQQTVYLVGFTEASVTPEVGQTYNLMIYGESDILLRNVAGLTDEGPYVFANADELLESGLTYGDGTARPNCRLTVKLESERDTYKSWQQQTITLDRADYGFSYGRYYGGYL